MNYKPMKFKRIKLSIAEINLIIKLLDQRRIFFESRNKNLALEASKIISKLGKQAYK